MTIPDAITPCATGPAATVATENAAPALPGADMPLGTGRSPNGRPTGAPAGACSGADGPARGCFDPRDPNARGSARDDPGATRLRTSDPGGREPSTPAPAGIPSPADGRTATAARAARPPALRAAGAALLALACLPASAAAAETAAGVRAIAAPAPARGAGIDVTIWYPAAEGGTPVTLGESVFFEGTEAMRDAPAAPGPHPVVLLSHGAGLAGRAEAMAWIAAPLAAAGYVVVAPTHPGNTGPDRSAAETIRLWQRPGDLSAALDALGRDPALAEVSDTGDAAVLGLSMGGGTALALAGARYDAGRLAAYCDDPARNPSLCGWLRASGVDLRTMDMTGASGDLRDARVRAVVALDPAPADVFDPASLADVSVPVRIVALGDPAAQPPTLQAGPLADGIPDAELIVVEGADHAGMFPPCKPGAAEIARAEGIEDPICPDGTADGTPDGAARPRADIHAELLSLTLAALEEAFGPE